RQSPIVAAAGIIAVHEDSLTQSDEWIFRKALAESRSALSVANLVHPVFASNAHLKAAQAHLLCSADGQPVQFLATLRPRTSLAFRRRSLAVAESLQASTHALPSPLLPLARNAYMNRGDRIAGD